MEDAANILGAGTLRTTFRVTLPLVLPAIVGGLIISFLEAIALFGAPALIALPARFHVVSTQLWQFFEYPVRVEQAAAYAMPLLLITLLMFWLQRSVLGRRGYTTVSGKGGERRIIRLGPWRWVMLGYALFVCALAVFLPMIVLTQAAFAQGLGPRLLARESHAAAISTTSCSSRPRRRTPSSTPSCIRASRRSPRSACRSPSPMW